MAARLVALPPARQLLPDFPSPVDAMIGFQSASSESAAGQAGLDRRPHEASHYQLALAAGGAAGAGQVGTEQRRPCPILQLTRASVGEEEFWCAARRTPLAKWPLVAAKG